MTGPGIPINHTTKYEGTIPGPGCLLLNKHPGQTSFESLFSVKKAFATGKVCHTGTLDKFARGLLVVLVGPAVKLASRFSGCDKRYRAVVRFGEETDTLDPEGTVVAAGTVPEKATLENILPRFTGVIMQAPPLFSAVHVNGVRAHKLARSSLRAGGPAGNSTAVTMKERPVTVYSLKLLSWDPPLAELEVHCSAGTYIRSLARDMALALGSRAYLLSLTRTAVGNFFLDEALSLPAPEPGAPALFENKAGPEDGAEGRTGPEALTEAELLRKALMPLKPELFSRLGIPSLDIGGKEAAAVSHGGPLRFLEDRLPDDVPELALALFCGGSFAALVERTAGGGWKYGYVVSGA
jgi:tRNA pseudouridine55 synthase